MDLTTHKPFSKIGGLSLNIYTGRIKFYANWMLREEDMSTGNWIKINSSPAPNCKKCYGRGYIGKYHGKCIPCRCIFRRK